MPYYLLEATDSNKFTYSRVIQNLSAPNFKDIREWMSLPAGRYTTKIEKLSDCYGCAYECGGQKDHMECPSGCLHDKTSCFECSE